MLAILSSIAYDFLLIFLPLFFVVDPAGALPLFLALTEHYSPAARRTIARRAAVVAAITGVLFVIVGQALFAFLGVRFADFQIAGGILLVVLSIIDLLSPGKPAVDEAELRSLGDQPPETVGIVPLAVPLIVGPATMTTSLLLVSTYSAKYAPIFGPHQGPILVIALVCAALVANLILLYIGMVFSDHILRILGKSTMAVINKIVMILLAAIAISLIRQGITSIVRDLK